MRLFVVYIDILGFGRILEEIAKKVYLTPEEIKQRWKDKINRALNDYTENRLLIAFDEISLDSWAMYTKAADDAYRLLENLCNLGLPFEIAVHFENFKESNGLKLSDQMMQLLKNNILGDYRDWYKRNYGKSIDETFILATQEAYLALGSDVKLWEKPYNRARYFVFTKRKASIVAVSEYVIAGRRNEIGLFRQLLNDQRSSYGLWVYGPGGIGKSALVRQCCLLAKSEGYRIIGDKDKVIKESPTQYYMRVCGFEKDTKQFLEWTDATSEVLTKLTAALRDNTVIVMDASKDFDDYTGLLEFLESFVERLKGIDNRAFLLIATRKAPRYTPSHVALTRLGGLSKDEIVEFIDLKGGTEELKRFAPLLEQKTGGWPLILEAICSSP